MKSKQELLAQLGFDALFINCEHSSTDFQVINELTRATQEDLEAVTHFMRLGMRHVNVHMKQFMDCSARVFLAGLK